MTLLQSNLFVANKTFLAVVFFLQQALSNVHSVRATSTDKDPLTWNFNPKVLVGRLQYLMFLASTCILSCKVATVIEFTEKIIFIVKP